MSKEVQPFQEQAPATIANAGMSSGGSIAGLVPQNLEDAFRLSKALSVAGDMVPQNFRGNPEATMAAVLRGMEIGLAPMQALSNIAVINGRASLWGDAIPALMQRAGHHIDVVIEGEGDKMKAIATLERGDTGKVIKREFSVADAKAANLWDKKGPWQAYPKRMLTHRARSWAVRDGAADALMGLQIAEEMQDAPPIRDITPAKAKPGGFAAMAQQARQQQAEPEDAEEVQPVSEEEGKPIEGEILPAAEELEAEDEAHSDLEEPEAEDQTPSGPPEFDEGYTAFQQGKKAADCPYAEDDLERRAPWMAGWKSAQKEGAGA